MESWDLQVGYFSRRYRTITYNAKGYPPSDVPAPWEEYTYDHQVKVLLDLLDHLQIAKAHICGLSMGAYTAVQFGLAHPDRCLSIVAAGVGTGSDDPATFLTESESRAELLEAGGMEGMSAYLSGSTRIRFREKDPAGWNRFAQLFGVHSPKGSANTLRGFQGRRPSLYTREGRPCRDEHPVPRHVRRRGRPVPPALALPQTYRTGVRAGRTAAYRPRLQLGGASRLQCRSR